MTLRGSGGELGNDDKHDRSGALYSDERTLSLPFFEPHEPVPARWGRDRTASRVSLSEVTSELCDSRRTTGFTSHPMPAGTPRLKAIASSSTYTPPSRSWNREMLNRRQMKPLPVPGGSFCSEGCP